jgi:hypothetical protein
MSRIAIGSGPLSSASGSAGSYGASSALYFSSSSLPVLKSVAQLSSFFFFEFMILFKKAF